jgi:hypothetical protein
MGYYQGDYSGDFYQGDPFWGAAVGRVARLGFGVGKKLLGWGGKGSAAAAGAAAVSGAVGTVARRVGGIVAKHPVLSAAGAAGTIGVLGGMGGERAMIGMGGGVGPGGFPRGFHMSKPRRGVAPHLVRNRHMRVTNPRALRRAIRRATGFAKLAMRTIHLVNPRKKGRFGGFRKRRAKR